MKLSAVLSLSLAGVLAGPAAWACGGLFCSTGPTPQPVDQSAERIVFEVDRGRITAHVQITYAGGADNFAWVVPVPSVPDVEESSTAFIQAIDQASAPQVMLPPSDPCDFGSFDGNGGGGCGCAEADQASAGGGNAAPRSAPEGNVVVYAQDVTDNYEFAVVGAVQTSELVTWLQMNGYNVSANMTPVMDVYNGPTAKFLALKLRDGRTVSDIVPIKMTYDGTMPMIPIRLTAVAAQPMMGILVYILADRPYEPSNYMSMRPDISEILFDANGRTSYFEWVARTADELEGKVFITEMVAANPIRSVGGQNVSRHTTLSRFYTRMSPHHMTEDPMFEPHSSGSYSAAALIDLSAQPTQLRCFAPIPERAPSACAFNYCGQGATCAIIDGQVACDCPQDSVAQRVTGPTGQATLTCVPRMNPFAVTATAAGAGTAFDPCRGYDCGQGECVLKGGFPTCECRAESAALIRSNGTLGCDPLPATTPTYGPGAGNESRANPMMSKLPTDRAARYADLSGVWFAALLVLGVGVARKLGRRSR